VATHKYILSAGHRNTNRGGARGELAWTYPSAVALKAAIVARGGKAWIIQEEDGDADKTFFPGGLQQAASKCVELAKKHGPFDAYISSHYNGGASPGFHAIFPDGGTGDTKADNPLDVKLCRAMRDAVKATGTVGMLSWTKDSPGVMSEKETGVGAQGYRLGEMVGTLGFRGTTARVIIEAGSIDVAREAAFINDSRWVRDVYAEAIVNALEAVFGKFSAAVKPAPVPVQPAVTYPAPAAIAALDRYKTGDANTIPAEVDLGDGIIAVYVNDRVRAIRSTPRLLAFDGSTDLVGPAINEGQTFEVDWLIVPAGKPRVYRTPYGTIVKVADTVRVSDAIAA